MRSWVEEAIGWLSVVVGVYLVFGGFSDVALAFGVVAVYFGGLLHE